jgi:hypothetical protein
MQPSAEGVGFEPTLACTKHVFKTCTFSRSVIPPQGPDFFEAEAILP